MASTFRALAFFFAAVVLLRGGHARGGEDRAARVHDVTEYGAAPKNRDNKDAFLAAWRAACHSAAGNSTLLVPKGTFAVGTVRFEGPCRTDAGGAPAVAVVIDGVLQPCAGGGGGRGGCHLSDDAWIMFTGLNNLVVTGNGTLDGQGHRSGGKSKSKPTTLVFDGVTNSTLSGLAFLNSRGFHVNLRRCAHVVASGLGIRAPATSRNTDSVIGTGDDCVSIGPGSTDIVVDGVTCGPGHGLSVGSLGKRGGGAGEDEQQDVRGVVVRNCTVKGATNGVRIKTWPAAPPSRASNITFEDIAMAGVSNPIIIDQRYCPHDHCAGADKPSLVQISGVTYRRIEGTSRSPLAVRLLCSEERPCTGVRIDGVNLTCGDAPCRSELSNVLGPLTGAVTQPPSPAPAVAAPPVRGEEEEADVASGTDEQLGRLMWWLPFTVRGRV